MRAPEVLRRAWRLLSAPAEEPREPLAALFERVNDSRPRARPEPEVLDPETLAALDELAAQQEAQRAASAAPARRRWTAVAAAAALLGGAGALAAVSWTVWSSDFGGEGSREGAPAEVVLVLAPAQRANPAPKATIVLVVRNGNATLRVSNLAPAPRDQIYRAWVNVGGDPKPAARFRGGRRAVVPLTQTVPEGARVTVRLEPTRHADTPSGKLLYTATR